MTAPREIQEQRRSEWDFDPRTVPEPPELTAQSTAIAAQREHQAQKCGDCEQPRSSHFASANRFDTTIGHPFVETCPNEGHDYLCAWHDDIGAFVPEAGCPVHDKDVTR